MLTAVIAKTRERVRVARVMTMARRWEREERKGKGREEGSWRGGGGFDCGTVAAVNANLCFRTLGWVVGVVGSVAQSGRSESKWEWE